MKRIERLRRAFTRHAALLGLLAAWLLPALACNRPDAANPVPTFGFVSHTPISTFTLGPTATRTTPTAMPPPPTAVFTLTPTYSPGFQEQFDAPLDRWTDIVVVTTQAIAGRLQSTFTQKGGVYTLNLADQETYLYRFYKSPQPADVYVEFEFVMDGQKENAAALVCRAAEDQSRWYEARISGNGEFSLYRYDKSRKTDQGINPYVLIGQDSAKAAAFDPDRMNLVRLTCQGKQIRLDFNRGSQTYTIEDDGITAGGLAGFGAMTYGNLPVAIQIDEINAGLP